MGLWVLLDRIRVFAGIVGYPIWIDWDVGAIENIVELDHHVIMFCLAGVKRILLFDGNWVCYFVIVCNFIIFVNIYLIFINFISIFVVWSTDITVTTALWYFILSLLIFQEHQHLFSSCHKKLLLFVIASFLFIFFWLLFFLCLGLVL
jgi:hypothetical protein